jgi:hypothetical protein
MSKTTLSVEIDRALVERVRRYSEEHGQAVSQTVSEMISMLPLERDQDRDQRPVNGANGDHAPAASMQEGWEAELTPAVRSLLGAGAGPAGEEDYHRHLLEKYGR